MPEVGVADENRVGVGAEEGVTDGGSDEGRNDTTNRQVITRGNSPYRLSITCLTKECFGWQRKRV